MTDSAKTEAIFIPSMHGGLAPEAVRPSVVLFDPGCGTDGGFLPEALPMSPREARRYQRDMTAWGNEMKKPSDVASLAARLQGDGGAAMREELRGELAELSRMAGMEGAAAPSPSRPPVSNTDRQEPLTSQMVLILAWTMEDAVLAAAGAGGTLDDNWKRFSASLGLDEDGEELDAGLGASANARPLRGLDVKGLAEQGPPWPFVLEHMLRFLPRAALLVATSRDMLAAWREAGMDETPLSSPEISELLGGVRPEDVAGGVRVTGPGWKLLGRTAPVPGKEWLEGERTAVFVDCAGE